MVAPNDDANVRLRYSRMAGMGMQFGAAIVVFSLAGHYLDGKLGTSPLCLILGVLLGFTGGTISLVLAVRAANRDVGAPS